MKILLSIKPEYVEKIFNGQKSYEYRKCTFRRSGIRTVVVYSTMPVGQIVGEFDVDSIIFDEPGAMWEQTQEGAGIDIDFFMNYYEGKSQATAIKIGTTRLYEVPVNPKQALDQFTPPQSFCYLEDEAVIKAICPI